jgi:hypothetical protein
MPEFVPNLYLCAKFSVSAKICAKFCVSVKMCARFVFLCQILC